MKAQEILNKAKEYRMERDSIKKLQIAQTVPTRHQSAFLDAVESLANPSGVNVYTNKKGEACGVVVFAKGTGKRGLYISNETLREWNELNDMVTNYRLKPSHTF